MGYHDLELLFERWNGKICFFGAGLIGSTWAYDILKEMGIQIDFYCDNGKEKEVEIRDGIKTISLDELYSLKDNVLVFITVSYKHQIAIREQLEKKGICNIVEMDYLFLQNFINDLVEKNDQRLNEKFKCILDDKEYISRQFMYYTGYWPNIDKPQTFNEKLQWLKLYDRKPEYTKMVDKYEVKKYIADLIGKEFVIPTLKIYDSSDEINFEELPEQFVLKCNHNSSIGLYICRDKSSINEKKIKRELQDGIEQDFYLHGREWPYKNVVRKIICEKYLVDGKQKELIDYKFYCFNGQPKFLYVSQGLENHKTAKISFLNLDWTFADFYRSDYEPFEEIPEKPQNYEKMIEIAKVLSKGIPFVRVDLYEVKNRIYFGELTLTPCSGMIPFMPQEADLRLGEMLELPDLNVFK
ncbi:MAG: glycosyl transferase [Lachnospiraceae bacterium]|nr:glycosyl transferase [Lachnospiraceae bacterium]